MRRLADWREMPLEALVGQIRAVCEELCSAHRELAQVLLAKEHGKAEAWLASGDVAVSVRDRFASCAVVDLSADEHKLRGEIKALEVERDFLTLGIEHDVRAAAAEHCA